MGLSKIIRASDSPFLQAVTLYQCDAEDGEFTPPDGAWDLVVMKRQGTVALLLTGQTTTAVRLEFSPGDEFIALSFKASSYLNFLSPAQMIDTGVLLPSSGARAFRLGGYRLEIPRFDNAESLVAKLAREGGLERDRIVDGLLFGEPWAASTRSVQRHFQQRTGLTQNFFRQIQRAHQAVRLLNQGIPAVDTAMELGFTDQSHMSKSLKRIWGRNPGEILISK